MLKLAHSKKGLFMAIGDRIKERRKELRLKQQTVANAADISGAFLSEVENNKKEPSVATLTRLCDILDCTSDFILGRSNSPQTKVIIPPPETGVQEYGIHKNDAPLSAEELRKIREIIKRQME